MPFDPTYIPIHKLAHRTGLPQAWLEREAEAQQLPAIRVGRRWMFDREAVESALTERAKSNEALGINAAVGRT